MPLNPARYVRCRLADPTHKLPWSGRLFGANTEDPGHELVDLWNGHNVMLIAGGSIVQAPKEIASAKTAAPMANSE
jgi:hypothetical protein